jgi:hypothetical protein
MLSIEFRQVLKDSIIILLILAGLSMGIIGTDKDAYLGPVFEIFLLLYSAYAGWSMFARERNDGAMEYLLSLPVSRLRMVFVKLIPRALGAVVMLGIYVLLHNRLELPTLVPPIDFAMFYATFFLVGMSLSICIKTFISAVFITTVLSGGLTFINWLLSPGNSQTSICFQANAPLVLFPVLFLVMIRYYDVRPALAFNLKFVGVAFALAVVIAGGFYFIGGEKWYNYYMTDSGDIFRSSHSAVQILRRNGEQQYLDVPAGCHLPVEEEGAVLYLEQHKAGFGYCLPEALIKLNLDNLQSKIMYRIEDGWGVVFQSKAKNGILKNGKLYIMLRNRGLKQYKIVEIDTQRPDKPTGGINNPGSESPVLQHSTKSVEIPISGDLHQKRPETLVHVSQEPLRFIISTEDKLFRLDEKGIAKELTDKKFMAVWNDRLLVFNNIGMTLYRLKDGRLEPLLEKENIKMMPRRWGPVSSRKIIVQESGKYYIFNMEDMAFQEISIPNDRPYYYLERGEGFYIVWVRQDEISVGEIRDGKLVMKKKWNCSIKGFRIIQVFYSGISVNNSEVHEKYWFE